MRNTDTQDLGNNQITQEAWTITDDGPDFNGKTIYMVRYNGEPYTRAYSMSGARHLVLRYKNDKEDSR